MNYLLFVFHKGSLLMQEHISTQITHYVSLISEDEETRYICGEGNFIISFKSSLTKPQLISSFSEMSEGLGQMFDYVLISKPKTFITNIEQENIDFLFKNKNKRPLKNTPNSIENEIKSLKNLFGDFSMNEKKCDLTLDQLLDKISLGGGIKSLTNLELNRLKELSNNLNNEG